MNLSRIGHIRIKMHWEIEGEIKTCALRKNASGEWDVSLSCVVDTKLLPINEESVGIDAGIQHFAVLKDRQEITNPRFFQKGEKKLEKAQKKLSKLQKGTSKRREQGKIVAKIHERIRNHRKDFCYKIAKKIVDQYQYICVEDLNIKKMVEKSDFAKSILDVSWNQFRQFLTCKAAEAGRKLGVANPAYTSQTRSRCKHRQQKKLSERGHCCSKCGYKETRDFNAAQNILALGLDGLGVISRSLRL